MANGLVRRYDVRMAYELLRVWMLYICFLKTLGEILCMVRLISILYCYFALWGSGVESVSGGHAAGPFFYLLPNSSFLSSLIIPAK